MVTSLLSHRSNDTHVYHSAEFCFHSVLHGYRYAAHGCLVGCRLIENNSDNLPSWSLNKSACLLVELEVAGHSPQKWVSLKYTQDDYWKAPCGERWFLFFFLKTYYIYWIWISRFFQWRNSLNWRPLWTLHWFCIMAQLFFYWATKEFSPEVNALKILILPSGVWEVGAFLSII